MFSQFFEKKHLRINGTFKNHSQTQTALLNEQHTPKSSLKSLTKLTCQSSQKMVSTSPFANRSKSPIIQNYQKNLINTPKNAAEFSHKDKETDKLMG